ncbi:hypothetical protein SASPL_111773 [Salvia splendens]|uniref:Uncharacterized protein n=1 Tax=Salvia splendens TaxID=180675 RepID=A0A8X9A3M8_SALSN|nr:hypothetical protein SASPL_111773 [Salvia splendens]
MGLAVVVLPLAKLGGAALLLMVSLLWPFAVKFGFSYGPLREICWDMADALRLLMLRVTPAVCYPAVIAVNCPAEDAFR